MARIENLSQLTRLSVLELADNDVSEAAELNAKLGQVERIDLSHNKLKSLSGFSRLYSLRHLNVAANRIKELDSVRPVSGLPCLESLNLQGNVVTTIVDYRWVARSSSLFKLSYGCSFSFGQFKQMHSTM